MTIRFTTNVLAEPRWHPLLDVIATILQQPEARHSFDISQYDVVARSPWLSGASGARASTAEFIRASAKAASRDGLSDAVTLLLDDLAPQNGENLPEDVIRIHPFGGLTILMQPLHLIVEDESSDGAFILWMARLLGRDGILRTYRAGRLFFRHAGGKDQLVKSAKALTFGVWLRADKPILSLKLRAIALLDSDARFPGDEPNKQIVRDVEPYVAFVHLLSGRSIESYIPLCYAQRRLGKIPSLDAFFRMSEIQRSHFPIKKGFKDNASPPNHQDHVTFLADVNRDQAERDHFRSVDPHDWARFASGFGVAISSVFWETGSRSEPRDINTLTRIQRTELNDFFTRLIRYL